MSEITKECAIRIASRANFSDSLSKHLPREIFGKMVFNDEQQRKFLPKEVYKKLRKTIQERSPLVDDIADVVANGMKLWALSLGATHFTHWFQPLTGSTAEKHDAFFNLNADGTPIDDFSGKELIQGEPDASSFPSGGIRETFEARGYTAWDPISPAYVKDNPNGGVLCIPTAFFSYTGEALDLKAPLLRSQEALSKSAVTLLGLLGNKTSKVYTTAGLEQEYFVIDAEFFNLRPDMLATGRTLFGSSPFKGQELSDHYFGAMNKRVLAFTQDAEKELYELGIPMKTRHNEVAPCQFEVAPFFEDANVAVDHNLMIMEVLSDVAMKHNLRVILHEKPFSGMNGSGKHCNWSMATADGKNLLDPGEDANQNMQFMVILSCVVRSIDIYAKLLRLSVASAGNDHRLGANEAPPAIISIFLGEHLQNVVESIVNGTPIDPTTQEKMKLGVSTLPLLPKDNTDRNRTSPFAFTGNKFEFRALGSNQNPSSPNYIINTAVADSMDYVAETLQDLMNGGKSLGDAVNTVVKDVLTKHGRVIFNGDGYSEEWQTEAAKRGLPNLKTSPEAFKTYTDSDSIQLFEKYNVISKREIISRQNVRTERYNTLISIEAKASSDIVSTMILPACWKTQNDLANSVIKTEQLGISSTRQRDLLEHITQLINDLIAATETLDRERGKVFEDLFEEAAHIGQAVLPAMNKVRDLADALELLVDDSYWPLPKYSLMLSIN